MCKQLGALLEVVEQVAQTSLIDVWVANGTRLFSTPELSQAERQSLDWLTGQVLHAHQPIVIPDVLELPHIANFFNARNTCNPPNILQFYAGFPICNQQQCLGVLSVMAREAHSLTPNQCRAIATLANQIGPCLTSSPPLADSDLTTGFASPVATTQPLLSQDHAALMQLSMALQQCLSLEDLNNQLLAVLPNVLPINAFELILRQSKHAPRQVCVWPSTLPIPTEPAQVHCHSPADLPHCVLAHYPTISRLNSPKPSAEAARLQTSKAPNSPIWQCYPLIVKRRTIGVLRIGLPPSTVATLTENSAVFHSIAAQVSIALHRIQLFQKLQSENLQDPLTKLFNRRYMMSVLSKLLKRVSYGHYQVGVIMMDIDHFKQFNDTYGHAAGDQILQVMGLFLKGHARPNDAMCRFGGEEFALILSDLTWDVLERRAHQLCRGVRYLSVKVNNENINVTLSAGYAIAPLHGKTPSTLLQAADQALYVAKQTGRDRAVGASPTPDP